MSTNAYKGGLSVGGGAAFDKTKLQLRRPTPDSDVLASSDDDREHVPAVRPSANAGYPGGRRQSSGWIHDIQPSRKLSLPSTSFAASQPPTPAGEGNNQARPTFPWNTPSFTAGQSSSRLQEIVPSPTSAVPLGDKHSSSPITESNDGIGFLLTQHNTVRKSGRSLSYSVGQGDRDDLTSGNLAARTLSTIRNRPSKPSLLGDGATQLGQLLEDDVDELESVTAGSEGGMRLPAGYWEREQQKQQALLLKQATLEQTRNRTRAPSTASPHTPGQRKPNTRTMSYGEYAIEELDDSVGSLMPSLGRRFSEHAAGLTRGDATDDSSNKTHWATQNIAADVGRRHSFAHYGGYHPTFQQSTLGNTQEVDEEEASPPVPSASPPADIEQFDPAAYFSGYGPASRAINASAISAAHPAPITSLPTPARAPHTPSAPGRPGRRLFVITFKCSRADIYYLYDNTGLEIRCGDLVIVEGDRGADLGQVAQTDVTYEDAKKYKSLLNEEHYRWLVMFSQYSVAGTSNGAGMLGALARAHGYPGDLHRNQITSMGAQQDQDAKPKMIKRVAQHHEVLALRDKEGHEAKARRVGAQKAAEHRLPMEILDAEYQADYHKLTYFYYAETYVNFNDLVTDLFKQYKVRIWMSAVNPASVVNPAGLMQISPPSAIGPGAILPSSAPSSSLPVGPGFGQNSFQGRGRGQTPQDTYDGGYYPFSHQLPAYQAAQQGYGISQWGMPYGRYGYPSVTASGSPMNYGAYYPPVSGVSSAGFGGPGMYGGSMGGGGYGGIYAAQPGGAPAGSRAPAAAGATSAAPRDQGLTSAMQNLHI